MKSAHTTTDTAVVLLLLIVMLPIATLAGIRNWLLPLDRDTVCGDASVYEPLITGDDMLKPPHKRIYAGCTTPQRIPELSSELFAQ